jgi:glycyl-tRNA synthetase
VHSKKTGEPLVVREPGAEPLKIEEWQVVINKAKFGPTFRKDAKAVEAALLVLGQSEGKNSQNSYKKNLISLFTFPGYLTTR